MERNWEKRLAKFDRVWERVRGAAPPPPPPGRRPPSPPPGPGAWPPPPPPNKKCCGRGTRFCPRGFRG